MTATSEHRIHEHLLRQVEIYDRALPVAEELAQCYEASPAQQAKLATLEEWMQQASRENQQMQELMPQGAPAARLNAEVKAVAHQLSRQIARMIALFDIMEKHAKRIKETLEPQLDESLRVRQMRAAYSNPDS